MSGSRASVASAPGVQLRTRREQHDPADIRFRRAATSPQGPSEFLRVLIHSRDASKLERETGFEQAASTPATRRVKSAAGDGTLTGSRMHSGQGGLDSVTVGGRRSVTQLLRYECP